MSFFIDNRTRQRLSVDGLTGQEPPLKRLRSVLGADPEVAFGLGRPFADPLSLAAHGTSLLGADARAWPLHTGFDTQMLAASGLPASLGNLGAFGPTASLGSLGPLRMPSSASAFIERNLSSMDASQVMALKDLGMLQANPLLSTAGTQLLVPNLRAKTKLCRHFIENNCRYQGVCNFAHRIEELKKMPDEGDVEGKALLERYKAKAEAEKQSTARDASTTAVGDQSKARLCKQFIEGTCKDKEACLFAHSIEELKKLPEENDAAEKALLDMYKAKAATAIDNVVQKPTQTPAHTSAAIPNKTMLCKQFIIGNCKLNNSCTFAHSLGELVSLPAEGDVAGKFLLELYQSKMEIEKPEQAETLTAGAPAIIQGAEKTSASDAEVTQKLGSSTNAASEVQMVDKSVRFLKTRMCKHFLVGACKFNKNCTFAHAIEELKPPADVVVNTNPVLSSPSQPVQLAKDFDAKQDNDLAQDKEDKQGLPKTKLCRFFAQGTCRFGDACSFIHNDQLLGTGINALQGPSEMKLTYKTRLCNMWEKDKTCTFGSNCHFAHGEEELRQRTGPIAPANNGMMYGALELEALARAQQLALPSSVSYSYNVTDTNWRPYRGLEEGINGLGGAVNVMNEGIFDRRAAEGIHMRGLLQDYGQLEQAGSLPSLSSLGGASVALGPNFFTNLPPWPTR